MCYVLCVTCYVTYVQSLSNLRPGTQIFPKPLTFQHCFQASRGDKPPNEENRRKESENLHEMPENGGQGKIVPFRGYFCYFQKTGNEIEYIV